MKRIVSLVVLATFLFVGGVPVSGDCSFEMSNANKTVLSSLDEDECMAFLSNMGVHVPLELSKNANIASWTKELIKELETNPNRVYSINYTVVNDYIDEVRGAVKSYYEISPLSTNEYSLKQSTVWAWDSSMINYNCYAYVLGRNTACDPGDFSNQSYDPDADIEDVADLVKDDLLGQLGYSCVKSQTSIPTSTYDWSNVIAVRKDTDHRVFNDYHFAKMTSTDWFHKPGRTAVLKFKYDPSNSVNWTNECFTGSDYIAPDITYDSDIIYISYRDEHGSTTGTWTGNHYHSGTKHYYEYDYVCNDCGEFVRTAWTSLNCTGAACIMPWSMSP